MNFMDEVEVGQARIGGISADAKLLVVCQAGGRYGRHLTTRR